MEFSNGGELLADVEAGVKTLRGLVQYSEAVEMSLRQVADHARQLQAAIAHRWAFGASAELTIHDHRERGLEALDLLEGLLAEARPSEMAIVSGFDWEVPSAKTSSRTVGRAGRRASSDKRDGAPGGSDDR